jgi:predicted RNase H-like HicB family nuclease
MSTRYVVLIDGKRGAYGVVFPDLPGCTAMGRTIDEALRDAASAAGEWAQAVGKRLPRPRSIESLHDDPETKRALAHGAVLAVVPLIFDVGRPAKANVSLDVGTLEAIDDAARAHGLTRSAFITSAAREKIERGT